MIEEFYETSFLLPNSKNIIPYFKHLRLITGSVTASILMQQLEYWFSKIHGPFYKFLSPMKEKNGYHQGDSWTEELGFSKAEFRSAFLKIGIAYKSKKQFGQAKDKFQDKMYCSYYDRIERKTWYFRSKQVEVNLGKLRKLISGNQHSSFPEVKKVDFHIHCTENTSENTAEKPPITPQGVQANLPEVVPPFEIFWKAYPKKRNKGQAEKAFKKINPDQELLNRILSKIEIFKQSPGWRKEGGQYIPYPVTWLNARGWEDEITTEVKPLSSEKQLQPRTITEAKLLEERQLHKFMKEASDEEVLKFIMSQ